MTPNAQISTIESYFFVSPRRKNSGALFQSVMNILTFTYLIVWRANCRARGIGRVLAHIGNAKIAKLEAAAAPSQENVGGLHIPVDDASIV